MTPLADKIRPTSLDDIVGQPHLLAPGKPLRRILERGQVTNMIFYGPSGVGKTTLARIIANNSNMTLYKLNGTSASVGDIKEIIAQTGTLAGCNGILLYLDEIQYLNKKQQQSLLEYIENGSVTLIASTTENPYFAVFNAIISRSTVFEFKPVTAKELEPAVERAFRLMGQELGTVCEPEEGVVPYIAAGCGGDVRKAVNTVELSVLASETRDGVMRVTMETVQQLTQRSNMRYDRDGDQHYDLLSLVRRLLVIAAEDVGLAYPQAMPIVKACVDAALQLGLPEARIPIAEAVILLATAPKSNSAYLAIDAAAADLNRGTTCEIPRQLQNKHFDGADAKVRGQHYLYPHDYPNHWVQQQYLPDELKDRVYYHFGQNKQEQAARAYKELIQKK